MHGIIDIKVVLSLLLKSIKLKIENIVIFYKNFSLKNQQYILMIDNIRNIKKKLRKTNKAPILSRGFPGGSDGKASAYNAEDPGSIPGLGRSPGEGNGNPLQYSCLENSMD